MANEEIVKLDDVIKINQPLEIRLEYDISSEPERWKE